jgi:peptide/nickel transport system substrate-binding protein
MHKKVWFLAVAAFALIAVVGSASAMAGSAGGRAAARVPALPSMFASYPKTPAARAHASVLNIAQEQDLPTKCTWNFLKASCNKSWSIWVGVNPILRGPYVIYLSNGHYKYKYDLASKVVANSKFIRYTIRKNAKWNYGGVTSPVTWQDFAYSVEMLNAPGAKIAGNSGVNQISSFSHSGNTVTFFWKKDGEKALGGDSSTANCDPAQGNACGPFADYKDTIGAVMPFDATHTLDFNTQLFHDCICGANGKYITDGPYYMSKYVRGQGTTLKANPRGWYGPAAKTKTLNFTVIGDSNSEVQAVKGGEVDIADPQPNALVAQLRHLGAVKYSITAGNYLEHIDISQGASDSGVSNNPLLKQAWFRQAIMMGINRQGIINAALPGVGPASILNPLNSVLVFQNDSRYKAPFKKWDFAKTGNGKGTIKAMKAHGCTGGPSVPSKSNTKFWTCNGHSTAFHFLYANDNFRRVQSAFVLQANLKAVGIDVTLDGENSATGNFFTDAFNPASGYDTTEFAWGGSVDPSGFSQIWGCGGPNNNGDSCNHAADNAMNASLSELNVSKRNADIIKADKLWASSVPAIPLYALPDTFVWKKATTGEIPNPATGFTWNAEAWHWK